MGQASKIEWTHHTMNPWRGCTKVSPGCFHCYAETLSHRNPSTLGIWGPNGSRVLASEAKWREPLTWDEWAREGVCWHCGGKSTRPTPGRCQVCNGTGKIGPHRARVFCASLADVFEDWDYPKGMVNAKGRVMAIDASGQRITDERFQKGQTFTPLLMDDVRGRLFTLIDATPNLDWLLLTKRPENICRMMPDDQWRANLWLMTSVENADQLGRIDKLKEVGEFASILGLSIEPLLGPMPTLGEYLDGIDLVIVGGESGPGARPMHPDWVRSIRDQCIGQGVKFFFKQWGEWVGGTSIVHDDGIYVDAANGQYLHVEGNFRSMEWHDWNASDPVSKASVKIGKKAAGRMLDGRVWDEMPEVQPA
jgi:protein gp37